MKIEKSEVYGFGAAFRELHNSFNSWNKSDSYIRASFDLFRGKNRNIEGFILGKGDKVLAQGLIKNMHFKFLKQIHVWVDLDLPLHMWDEFNNYNIINSDITMQVRIVNTNYAELLNIYFDKHSHNIYEWCTICEWIEQLPYFAELTNLKEEQ